MEQKIQRCVACDDPTGLCEDDSLFTSAGEGPFCQDCYHETDEYKMADLEDSVSALKAENAELRARVEALEKAARIPKCRYCGWAKEFDDGNFCHYREKMVTERDIYTGKLIQFPVKFSIDIDEAPPKNCPLRAVLGEKGK